MTYQWVDCERAFIAQRYDRIAGLIGLFDRLLFLPPDLRRRAAACLNLKPGDRVLEIGCGTGRNFPFLRGAVGPAGKIYGVDLSRGMLRRARALCRREHWRNVHLTQCDASEYIPCEPLDGILYLLAFIPRLLIRLCVDLPVAAVRAARSDEWTIEAVSWAPYPTGHKWSTTREFRGQVLAQVEGGLARGETPRPRNARLRPPGV